MSTSNGSSTASSSSSTSLHSSSSSHGISSSHNSLSSSLAASHSTSSTSSSGSSSSTSTTPSPSSSSSSSSPTFFPSSSSSSHTPQSSSPTPNPGSSSSTSSTSSPSNDVTSTMLTAPSTSVYQTTSVETSNGIASTIIVTQTSVYSAGTVVTGVASTSSQSNTNIAPIVGGVVGGVVGLALLALIVFFFLRWCRRRSLDDEFDGDFDPRHVAATGVRKNASLGGTLPRVHGFPEEDDGMGGRLAASDLGIRGTVTPFYDSGSAPQQEMSENVGRSAAQIKRNEYSQAGPSHSAPPLTFSIPQTTSTGSFVDGGYNAPYAPTVASSSTGGYYSRAPMQPQQQQLYLPPGSDVGSSRGGKERNPTAVVSNPEENPDVIVHQDGGRAEEIPPSYDSIPADERR